MDFEFQKISIKGPRMPKMKKIIEKQEPLEKQLWSAADKLRKNKVKL
jgi:hypothetical protein